MRVSLASSEKMDGWEESANRSRREMLVGSCAMGMGVVLASMTVGEGAMAALPAVNEDEIKLCTADCEASLDSIPTVTTESGLQYKDIVVGKGPSPPIGFQVAANYVAMLPNGRVFDSSLEKKVTYIFRVGSGQVVKGLDEGILSMRVGGLRRIYVPGELAFPKGLPSAAGRPRVAPASPVVFDVSLLYIPGFDDDEE